MAARSVRKRDALCAKRSTASASFAVHVVITESAQRQPVRDDRQLASSGSSRSGLRSAIHRTNRDPAYREAQSVFVQLPEGSASPRAPGTNTRLGIQPCLFA